MQPNDDPGRFQNEVLRATGIAADDELRAVLETAARIGVLSGDEVLVSYTSLFLAMLQSEDKTSRWLAAGMGERKLEPAPIYRQRRIEPKLIASIRDRSRPDVPFDAGNVAQVQQSRGAPSRDPVSISARTVLDQAAGIARECGLTPSEPLGVRHVLAAYVFRNPPGHDGHLTRDWGFDLETWRRAFASFLAEEYAAERSSWTSVLAGYGAGETKDGDRVPGEVLANYAFDAAALRVMRAVEHAAAKPRTKGRAARASADSKHLLDALRASDDPDGRDFAKATNTEPTADQTPSSAESAPFADRESRADLTSELKEVLDRARLIAGETSPGRPIATRHLIASLMLVPASKAAKELETTIALPRLRRSTYQSIVARWVNDEGERWRFHLIGDRPPQIAKVVADDAESGADELDVTRFARAFAAVIASRQLTPPLSIGVFGDWGSGKSFFMRLMRTQTDAVLTAPEVAGQVVERVVSVKFNAWHYAESNLWASLVQEILEQLHAALSGGVAENVALARAIDALELAKQSRAVAQAQFEAAEDAVERAEQADAEAERRVKSNASRASRIAGKELLAFVDAGNLPRERLRALLDYGEKQLGIRDLTKVSDAAGTTAAEFRSTLETVQALFGEVRGAGSWFRTESFAWAKLAGLAVAVLALGSGAFLLTRESLGDAWAAISTVLLQAAAVTTRVLQWAKSAAEKLRGGVKDLSALKDEFRRAMDAAGARRRRLTSKLGTRHEAARSAADDAHRSLVAAKEAVERAARALLEETAVRKIANLIRQRIDGQDYAKHLGIISAIRKDFATLSSLLTRSRTQQDRNAVESAGAEIEETSLPLIDRIVLYVDDLDRCPADKVVAMLEAIHLLLAIDLFVVVVGVDIRWAAQSLLERYPNHLRSVSFGATPDATQHAESASALDYLEKIFQVPFWLPPMEAAASQELIRALVPVEATAGATPSPGEASKSEAPDALPAGSSESAPPAGIPPGETKAVAPTTRPLLDPGALHIEAAEREFMLKLAGAMGKSPRRLKRFVNTYRILKASLDGTEAEEFVLDHGKGGAYRAAMAILAMLTGAPRLSIEVLRRIAAAGSSVTVTGLLSDVAPLKGDPEFDYLDAGLCAYRDCCGEKAMLTDLKYWAPRVARFSFRSGRA